MDSLGKYPLESVACLARADEYPGVRLRMNYPVTFAGGVVEGGLVCASDQLIVSTKLAEARKQLNQSRIGRSMDRREFESEVRRFKEEGGSQGLPLEEEKETRDIRQDIEKIDMY